MKSYKVLSNQEFSIGKYSLVPLRSEDRYDIMNWRNEQIYHLRQNEPLTKEKQDEYFLKVVANLFEKDQPDQILFSFLEDGTCVAYGGLVHINWIDKNAEVSFVIKTELENDFFDLYWSKYLRMLEQLAFRDLKFHKLYVYAFDLRPKLYVTLEKNDFFHDATLKDHCLFDGKFIDVVIHSKISQFKI